MGKMGFIGVPSSAGAHGAGQEKAPAHLRRAGLVEALGAVHLQVEDLGDLPVVRFQPDPEHPAQQSLSRVVKVAHEVARKVDGALRGGLTPFVIGGDCSILLGVVAGFVPHVPKLGVIYVDGDADLKTPGTGHSGIFDSMGMAHLIGEGAPELSHIGSRFPLMPQEQIALFGFHPYEVEPLEAETLHKRSMLRYPVTELKGHHLAKAADALAMLEARADRILVHFDVDVIDSAEFPLADWPHYQGLTLKEAIECLQVFTASPKFGGLLVTEVNPDHDPDGALARRFIEVLAPALAEGARSSAVR